MRTALILSEDYQKFETLLEALARDFVPLSGAKKTNLYAEAVVTLRQRLRSSRRYGKSSIVLTESECELLDYMFGAGTYDTSCIQPQ